MRYVWMTTVVVLLGTLAFAGGGTAWWDIDDARMASKLELKVDKSGMHQEIEYEIPKTKIASMVPPAVIAAMEAKYPGLTHEGAEKEWEGGELFYELVVYEGNDVQNGLKLEVMFTPDGQIHEEENQVLAENVPQPVKDAIAAKYPQATDVRYEEIKDGQGQVLDYHVKLVEGADTEDPKHYKIYVQPDGFISGAYLEVQAELEVPAPLR